MGGTIGSKENREDEEQIFSPQTANNSFNRSRSFYRTRPRLPQSISGASALMDRGSRWPPHAHTPSSGTSAGSSNYPGDLTKGRHLTIYVEGLADPSSGFFRVLNNGAQQAGKDLGVDVKYRLPSQCRPRVVHREDRGDHRSQA